MVTPEMQPSSAAAAAAFLTPLEQHCQSHGATSQISARECR